MRERGLKYLPQRTSNLHSGRSREGAWIEIEAKEKFKLAQIVAPVRERGLKYNYVNIAIILFSRSREGAWIEISTFHYITSLFPSLP